MRICCTSLLLVARPTSPTVPLLPAQVQHLSCTHSADRDCRYPHSRPGYRCSHGLSDLNLFCDTTYHYLKLDCCQRVTEWNQIAVSVHAKRLSLFCAVLLQLPELGFDLAYAALCNGTSTGSRVAAASLLLPLCCCLSAVARCIDLGLPSVYVEQSTNLDNPTTTLLHCSLFC